MTIPSNFQMRSSLPRSIHCSAFTEAVSRGVLGAQPIRLPQIRLTASSTWFKRSNRQASYCQVRVGSPVAVATCTHGSDDDEAAHEFSLDDARTRVEQFHERRSTNSFNNLRWEAIRKRLELLSEFSPPRSLDEGRWVKLICGASFEDVAYVRNLSLIYSLAGVDCIDCAADPAVVAAVHEGINAAKTVMQSLGSIKRAPWVMISVNDHEDPHFRKAEFSSHRCPVNCPRPCEQVCPASAIKFEEFDKGANSSPSHLEGGVINDRCYGCGRCLPICPLGLISARSYERSLGIVANLIRTEDVDAIEIHTGAGHLEAFQDLMSQIGSALTSLKLVAVSVPDLKESMIPALRAMYTSMQPFVKNLNLWQLDGRPMSGDIGIGATRAAIILAEEVTASQDRPPGYIQLAGGTNAHTATALRNVGLYGPMACQQHGDTRRNQDSEGSRALVAGVAYGGYARKIVHKFLRKMEDGTGNDEALSAQLELHPSLLADAVLEANVLVDGMKLAEVNISL